MKLQFLGVILICLSGMLTSFMVKEKLANKKVEKPNVLIMYTDDHRFTGIHALGKMAVKTPNMDELATNGIAFTNTYLMGSFSGATCVPSRAMLHTGRQLFKLKGQGHMIPTDHKTIGETFQEAGYNTHIVGKWHQDNASLIRSFDGGQRIMGRGVYLTDHYRMPLWDWDESGRFSKENAYILAYDKEWNVVEKPITSDMKRGPTGLETNGPHTSETFAESAVNYLTDYEEENPFMMYLAFHAPHDPRQAPEKYKKLYPIEDIELTPSYLPQHPFDNGHMFLRDEQLAPWPRTPYTSKKELADYYAIISHLDEQIGRVIKALKASGEYENTLIVLAGDSGLAVGNHGLMGKQNIYDEDGVHVPLILSGGFIKERGMRISALSYIHDIFPTICDLAGIQIPASVDGLSLRAIIDGEKKEVRDHTYHGYMQFQRAYRKGDFKLIEYVRAKEFEKNKGEFYRGSRVTQLFNVKKDLWEVYELSFLPENNEVLQTMRAEMREAGIRLGDNKGNVEGELYDFWDYY